MGYKTEIKCLQTLDDRIECFSDIIDFLAKEKVIDMHTKNKLSIELKLELPYALHETLNKALQDEILQLVDYKWTLLPTEAISITVITKHSRRDFTWNC